MLVLIVKPRLRHYSKKDKRIFEEILREIIFHCAKIKDVLPHIKSFLLSPPGLLSGPAYFNTPKENYKEIVLDVVKEIEEVPDGNRN